MTAAQQAHLTDQFERLQNARETFYAAAVAMQDKALAHMVALDTMFYNFVQPHKSLRSATPAMAAGVVKTTWDMTDVVALIDAREAPAKKRGPYEPRVAKAAA